MTRNADATFSPGSGTFWLAPTDTAYIADLAVTPTSPWGEIGHTSIEDILTISSEGGDATTLSTLQAQPLRTKYSTRIEQMQINLQQFDVESLKLFFGSNMTQVSTSIWYKVPTTPTVTTKAFLAILNDPETGSFAFYAPKAEIFRADDLDLADTESLASLPISVKPVVSGSNDYSYLVSPLAQS